MLVKLIFILRNLLYVRTNSKIPNGNFILCLDVFTYYINDAIAKMDMCLCVVTCFPGIGIVGVENFKKFHIILMLAYSPVCENDWNNCQCVYRALHMYAFICIQTKTTAV